MGNSCCCGPFCWAQDGPVKPVHQQLGSKPPARVSSIESHGSPTPGIVERPLDRVLLRLFKDGDLIDDMDEICSEFGISVAGDLHFVTSEDINLSSLRAVQRSRLRKVLAKCKEREPLRALVLTGGDMAQRQSRRNVKWYEARMRPAVQWFVFSGELAVSQSDGEEPEVPRPSWKDQVTKLETVWEQDGPFDGIVGFGTGAAAAALAARASERFPGIGFVVLFAGSDALLREHDGLIGVPSLHCFGKRDDVVDPATSLALASKFACPDIFCHGAGHVFLPRTSCTLRKLAVFFRLHARHTNLPPDLLVDTGWDHCSWCDSGLVRRKGKNLLGVDEVVCEECEEQKKRRRTERYTASPSPKAGTRGTTVVLDPLQQKLFGNRIPAPTSSPDSSPESRSRPTSRRGVLV